MCHIILNYKEKARAGISILLPLLSQYILNRNDKSEHTTHLDNVVRIIIPWMVLTKKTQVSILAHTKSHGVQEARIFLLHPDKKFAFLHPLESYEPF